MDGQSDVDSRELDEVEPMSKSRRRGRGRRGRGPAKPQTVPPTRPRTSKAASEEESVNVPTLEGSSNLQQEASRQDSPVHETQRKPCITPDDMLTAVFSVKTAMVTVVDEWLDSYKQDREEGLRVLINFIVKCCGCQGVVTKRMLDNKDYATIISSLTKNFTGVSEKYPLCSTEAKGKSFNKNLCEFVTVLVRSCENNLLYDDNLFSVLLPLLTTMSDSQVRAFRHTSTLLAMKLMTGIVDVSVKVAARLQTITRHFENEINKPVQHQDFTRLEDLQNTIIQLKDNLEELTAMTNSTFNGVFVNRYCDTVPEIRAICIQELGTWVMHNPGCFLGEQYIKHIGLLLYDKAGSVRLQCVRILQNLYQRKDFIGQLEMFTVRFKKRILCMAVDVECGDVGVEIMKLLLLIYQQTEEGPTGTECDHLYDLVFAKNRRLAAGAGTFIYNIWKQKVEKQKEHADQDDTIVFFQFLVTFYMKSGHSGADEHGCYLVDSLWGVPELRDWNTMTSLLLQEPGLEYEEEGALIELMICAIRRAAEAKPPAGREEGKKVLSKNDKENQVRDRMRITKHFIPVLPQLLAKYSADAKYVSRLLNIPLHFNSTNGQLDRYLDLLLEPVCDIVKKHTEASVLDACTSLFSSLCSEKYTFNVRSKTTISCLLDNLTDRFNPLVRKVLEGTADEDELYGAATALTKMAGLSRSFNITRLQLLEPCLQLLKKGVMSADMNKQLMVAALHTAASHLFWIKSSPAVMEPVKQVKRALKSFYKVSERCLSSDQAEIRNKAFELLCDLLVLYSGYVVRTQADLKMLSCSCPETLQIEMSGFLVDFIFTDPEDDEHADESGELKLAAVERKRNQLAGYCKLILFGVLDLKAAADVFKYYDKFYSDFGDIIKLFLNQTKLIDPVESAKTVGLCLQQLFTELNPTENTGKEFNEVKEVAKRHAMSLGVNLQPIQEQVQALHKQGIPFAFHDIQEVEGGTQPPKLLFLEILSEFSSKVLRKNRTHIIAALNAKCSKIALSWPSVRMYHCSLNTSISSPAQTKSKRPTIPEPAAPGSDSGSEGNVTFPSMENVDGSEGGAYSSPLPSNLGEPDFSSTYTKPTQLLGLDNEDGNIFEPETDESKMRNVTQRPQYHPISIKSNSAADMTWLSIIDEEEEGEQRWMEDLEFEDEDCEESNNSDSENMQTT